MKTMRVVLFAIAGLISTAALAATPTDSPLVGQWTLDVATLPMPPEMRPKSATLDFSELADGQWKTRVEIVDQGDKRLYSESTLSLDGTPGRASGTYWVDVIAAKRPAPNVLVMQFVYEGIPRSTRIYSVDANGVLTETETYFKEDATPMMRTALFNRAPGKP